MPDSIERQVSTQSPSRSRRALTTPPGWLFHTISVAVSGALLWSTTSPAGNGLIQIFALPVLVFLFGAWVIRLLGWAVTGRRLPVTSFVLGALPIVLVMFLASNDFSLKLRFANSRDAFEQVVANQPPVTDNEGWYEIPPPGRLGSYTMHKAFQFRDNVLFHDQTGGLLTSGGFAYLPDGPDVEPRPPTPYEQSDFVAIGDDWYVWTSSATD